VLGDSIQLQQVVVNLVMNAIDAVNQNDPYRRHILVKVERANDSEAEVSVKDNGMGLGGHGDQRQVFEPFVTTKEKGLGLGLYISSMIVKRHSGVLSLVDDPKEGATARFVLPLHSVGGREL
jgi:C4-dicarboxylate-specific signal transduction histidine kinase